MMNCIQPSYTGLQNHLKKSNHILQRYDDRNQTSFAFEVIILFSFSMVVHKNSLHGVTSVK